MFSGGPSLTAKLANIKHMPVLMAATVASDKPVEPYLVKDIIKMSFESSQARAFLQQYLLNQLVTSRNVYVKFKVLKLIENLLEKGHIEFKQNLRKQPEPLNEASRLRATRTKDGGILTECGRIRDLSNKLLEMLYSDAPELQPKRYPSPELLQSSQNSNTVSSSSRMEGFGNTDYVTSKSKSQSNTSDKLKVLFGSSTKSTVTTPLVYDQSYATMDPVPHGSNTGPGTVQYGGYNTGVGHAPGRYLEHGLPEGAPHRSGEAGGGWGNSDTHTQQLTTPSLPVTTDPQISQLQDNHIVTTEQDEDRNTEQERRLVDDITAPGGVKAAPPRDSLNKFISRCKLLDCLAVVEYLRQKLHSEQAQIALRTLFVLEAMLKSDIPDVISYLDLVLEELNTLTQSTNTSIKAKAKKIMHQLAAEDEIQPVTSSTTGSGVTGNDTVPHGGTGTILDLLGNGEEGGQEGEGEEDERRQEVQNNQASLPTSMSSLFAGMSVTSGPPSGGPPRPGVPNETVRSLHSHNKKREKAPHVAQSEVVGESESSSSFGDLLGLTMSPPIHTPTRPVTSNMVASEGDDGREEEVSLMDLGGEEEDFDPLTRSESVGSKSNSLKRSLSLGNKSDLQQLTTSSEDNNVMNQLSGLDLSITSHTDTTGMQNGIGTGTSGILQSLTLDQSLIPMSSSSVSNMTSDPTPLLSGVSSSGMIMGGASSSIYRVDQMPARAPYMATPVPYGMQQMGSKGMPMYTSTVGPSIIYMNQPRLGGDSRPVQRPQVHEPAPTSEFDFLGKSSKGSAFDFVKEEIDSAKKK